MLSHTFCLQNITGMLSYKCVKGVEVIHLPMIWRLYLLTEVEEFKSNYFKKKVNELVKQDFMTRSCSKDIV